MEHELQLNDQSLTVIPGSIDFLQYDSLKNQALTLSEEVKSVEVTDENVKHSKKLVAAINKQVKELEDGRIRVKKAILEPYQEFEGQVKEIVQIVKEADSVVREQIRELEEQERQEKEAILRELFEKRMNHYSFSELLTFEDFLTPRHLNKTSTLTSVEKEMVEFLERIEKDLSVIQGMDNRKEVLSFYTGLSRFDLTDALNLANEERQRKEKIEQYQKEHPQGHESVKYEIYLYDQKDFKLVELFMNQNNIKYSVIN